MTYKRQLTAEPSRKLCKTDEKPSNDPSSTTNIEGNNS